MDANELPTDLEELKAMFVATLAAKEKEFQLVRSEANRLEQQANELSATVTAQTTSRSRSSNTNFPKASVFAKSTAK